MLGLLLIWLTLLLLFKAHSWSNAYMVVGGAGDGSSENMLALQSLSNSRDKLLLPISMAWWGISPRQALDLIASHVGFDLQAEGVEDRLDQQSRSIHLQNMTLNQAIHRLLGREDVGYGLLNDRHLMLFPQRLTIEPDGSLPNSMRWEAELPLSLQPLIISPSEKANLSVSIYLREQADAGAGASPRRVGVELWNGPTWMASAQVELNAQGQGEVRMSNTDYRVELRLQRLGPGARPGLERCMLNLWLQRNGVASPAGGLKGKPPGAVAAPGAPGAAKPR
jgi:hypothetical protein